MKALNMKMAPTMTRAFTLVELMVAVAIIAILAALLFSGGKSAVRRANDTKCVSHQKSIAAALLTYAAENNSALPPYGKFTSPTSVDSESYWWNLIRPYLGDIEKFRCPAAEKSVTTTIGVNYAERPNNAPFGFEGGAFPGSMRLVNVSSRTILTADIKNPAGQMWFLSPNEYPLTQDTDNDGINDTFPGNSFEPRHNKAAICSFADGSVRRVTLPEWGRNDDGMWGP